MLRQDLDAAGLVGLDVRVSLVLVSLVLVSVGPGYADIRRRATL